MSDPTKPESEPVTEAETAIRAATRILMEAVLRLLQTDPHQWSTRPCPTCRAITAIVGEPFGCILYALQRAAKKE